MGSTLQNLVGVAFYMAYRHVYAQAEGKMRLGYYITGYSFETGISGTQSMCDAPLV